MVDRSRRNGRLAAIVVGLGILATPPVQPSADGFAPSGAAWTPGGDLYLISADGSLRRIAAGRASQEKVVPRLGSFFPIDLAAGRVGGEDRLLVLTYWQRSGQPGVPRLFGYSTAGEQRETWYMPATGFFAGLALDSERSIVYVAKGNAGEIYRLALGGGEGGTSKPEFVAAAKGVGALSAITLDSANQRLFVAAPYDGQLLALDLATRQLRPLVDRVGEVFALAYDAASRRLYAADRATGRVWKIDTAAPQPTAERFFEQPGLRMAAGLAIAGDGSLWVAYQREGVVVQISREGQLMRRIGLDSGRPAGDPPP
jgi:sugar lactone lactonase YvrE